MAVCYFNNDLTKKYNCEYTIDKESIVVTVSYNIIDEIPPVNGVIAIGNNTNFEDRDILIVDYKNNKNYLLKDAYYYGNSSIMGSPDGGDTTNFRSHIYFEHKDFNQLIRLQKMPKVKKIQIYSKTILDFIGCPSLTKTINDDSLTISLSKNRSKEQITLNKNYIKTISITDEWTSAHSWNERSINIDFSGCLEIDLTKRINFTNVEEFIYELQIFMQLYSPNRFLINKIFVMIDDVYYLIHFHLHEFNTKKIQPQRTVNVNILEFLKKCYERIPYRNNKTEIRNIPYIIMESSRNLEDNFLMFYRFIECYCKKLNIPGINKTFITYSINKHYNKKNQLTESEIERLSLEIIKLRNNYVHSGYYIKNASLKIAYEKVDGKKNPKDYTVTGIDALWIYERTKILYKIVIDIIFTEMLDYPTYDFTHMF